MTPIEYVDSRIGTPYQVNGRGPDSFDCFGLVADFYRNVLGQELGIEFEEMPEEWYQDHSYSDYKKMLLSENTYLIESPEPYCIVLLSIRGDLIDHIGVYLGEDKVLNTSEANGVFVVRLSALKRFKKLRGYARLKT